MAKRKRKKYGIFLLDEPIHIPDPLTGEVRETNRIMIPYGYKDENFCKVYYHTIQKLADLPKSCQKVMDWCFENMDSENKVYILNQRKIAKELGFTYGTVRNAISRLTKQGFLKKIENGLYMVNPSLACKVADNRDLLIQFVDSETFEEFVEAVTKEKAGKGEESTANTR